MPFTLSHAAAVLPLPRLFRDRLPLAALVAGSVSPDLGYYFGFTRYLREDAHTIPRSFTFCVPGSLVLLLALFLVRNGMAKILPASLSAIYRELLGRPLFSPRALPLTLIALLLGSWTHILWDSFTHYNGFFVQLLPVLRTSLLPGLELFRLLQHTSTVFGALAIFLFLRAACARLGAPFRFAPTWRMAFWAALGAATLLFTALTLTSRWNYALANHDHRLWFLFIVSASRNFFVLALVCAAAVSVRGIERTRLGA